MLHTSIVSYFIVYLQNAHQANLVVPMENALQQAGDVTLVLTAQMEVTSLIAVSFYFISLAGYGCA